MRGGFILGWDENREGDVVCWTDVFNGYVRKAGAAAWQQRFAGVLTSPDLKNPDPSQYWQAKLEAVPGRPGEWLYANCMEARDDDALLWSRDDGATWTALPARKLACWDFGKGIGDMPAVWFYGWHGDAKGWFVTYDWFASVQLVARYPADSIESVGRGLCMVGDMNTVGRCAIGLASNGWVFAEPADQEN